MIPLKLFRERVFNAASAIGFVMGFAMFGALTFLPLYMQIVKGVSPTASGLRILPLMLGMLGASVTSGRLVTRWGRYKVFPIVGTALMTVGAYLLSLIDASTNGWVLAGYMFVFGVGMGLVMQVLVVAVQNAVSYQDLGVATSSATFFRMIGGSFGTAVFGAIYAIVLNHTIAPTLAKIPASILQHLQPADDQSEPAGQAQVDRRGAVLLHEVHRCGDPLDPDRLPRGGADRLRVVPLELPASRGGIAQDGGDGRRRRGARVSCHAVVAAGDRACAAAALGAGEPGELYRTLAQRAGVDLHPRAVWLLYRLADHPASTASEVARRLKVEVGLIQPAVDSLVGAGMVEERRRGDDEPEFHLTAAGRTALERLTEARRQGLTELLEGWNPEEHPEVIDMVKGLAHALLADDDRLVADALPHAATAAVAAGGGGS